jgi:hypothetical protein
MLIAFGNAQKIGSIRISMFCNGFITAFFWSIVICQALSSKAQRYAERPMSSALPVFHNSNTFLLPFTKTLQVSASSLILLLMGSGACILLTRQLFDIEAIERLR